VLSRSAAEPAAPEHDRPRRHGGERGTVTAEFAVVLTAVLIVLALCIASVVVIGEQVELASLASSSARMLARGDSPGAVRSAVDASAAGTSFSQGADGAFVCVELQRAPRFGTLGLGRVLLSARACALSADAVPEGVG
jgi:Flp pilus assembly protein TadG